MTQSSDELHFFYDAQNKPAVVVYNGVPYSYVKNLQGDIVAILDSSRNVVVSYVYDAWGRPISKTGSMAATLGTVQPFRYRGYVYDEETEVYYLRNRYFSTIICRFINEDSIVSGKRCFNLFTYCENSPIISVDPDGRESHVHVEYFLAPPGKYIDIGYDQVSGTMYRIQRGTVICGTICDGSDGYANTYVHIREYQNEDGTCTIVNGGYEFNNVLFVSYRPWSALDVFGPDDLEWNPDTSNGYVRSLQYALSITGDHDKSWDGYYGPKTTAAVKSFQIKHKAQYPQLRTDGVADQLTKEILFEETYPYFDVIQPYWEMMNNR